MVMEFFLLLFNETPVSLALKRHALDIVSMLIEHGANKEVNGKSVFEVGLEESQKGIIKACVEKGEDLNKPIKVHYFLYLPILLIKRLFALRARKNQMILHCIS